MHTFLMIFLISAVQEEVSSLETRFAFGANLDLDLLGIDIDDKTLVPGLAVASSRAKPLAGSFLKSVVLFECIHLTYIPFHV